MIVDVDQIEMDELYDCEDELIRLYRRLGFSDGEYRRMVNLTKRKFRDMRKLILCREQLRRSLRNGKL